MEPSTAWVVINPCPFAVFWLAVLSVSFTAGPPVWTGQNFRKEWRSEFSEPAVREAQKIERLRSPFPA